MDPIVSAALVGTARQGGVNPVTGTPVDTLVEGLSSGEDERKFLLRAGAWAVYCQAGQKPQQITAVAEPAAPEKLRPASERAALLLSRLLNGEHGELLPEALQRMSKVGMYLPYDLLPQVLDRSSKEERAALFPVLGERGTWLSAFNPSWRWVQDFLPGSEGSLPADAETIWQEGTTAQRSQILRLLRATDPNKARDWLQIVWKQEKAEVRSELLSTLEIGLGASDEPFLENALDDRAASVRTLATHLLSLIPGSAFLARMYARGNSMLQFVRGTLDVKLPATVDKDWLRDGIIEKPPTSKLGKRAWWLIQVLSFIPPTYWEKQFALSPAELMSFLTRADEGRWSVAVIDGWSKAAMTHNASDWKKLLWNWWWEHADQGVLKDASDYTVSEQLLKSLSHQEAEEILLKMLNEALHGKDNEWVTFLAELPRPWSEAFGRACLQAFRKRHEKQNFAAKNFNPYSDPWFSGLSNLALSLPATCLAEAQSFGVMPEKTEGENWAIQYGRQQQREFVETVQMRLKIYEEIV
jgi:hypothetical protein